ncbi:FtsX-like permease family protein [Streptomyces boninensis]|uniref:FtsX-like permease family protein n=1 Tax=Streptomyces boninensis TaxID=2039455 RepID=UPI003B2162D8
MTAEARLAWALLRGSDRQEWLRVLLTVAGSAVATAFALAAVTVAAIRGEHNNYSSPLLGESGLRPGVIAALLLLLFTTLAFLGQCARIGAAHRDRRLAALRLTGGTPRQVRRIAALEAGLACLAGALLAVVVLLGLWAWAEAVQQDGQGGYGPDITWPTDIPLPLLPWLGAALCMPVLAVLATLFALRRVVAEPLAISRRTVRRTPLKLALLFGLPPAVIVTGFGALQVMAGQKADGWIYPFFAAFTGLVAAGIVLGTGAIAVLLARAFAGTGRPALLIAAHRLRLDPWAGARTHGTLLFATVLATAFAVLWQDVLATVDHDYQPTDASFYRGGYALAALAFAIGLAVTVAGLAVGSAESLVTRRRALAAQYAAGVPRAVLRRAVLLEVLLPVVPAVVVASAAGLAIGLLLVGGQGLPLLFPAAALLIVLAAVVLATASTLPLLHRTLQPAELRFE